MARVIVIFTFSKVFTRSNLSHHYNHGNHVLSSTESRFIVEAYIYQISRDTRKKTLWFSDLLIFKCACAVHASQWEHNVKMTSYQRRCASTLIRHHFDGVCLLGLFIFLIYIYIFFLPELSSSLYKMSTNSKGSGETALMCVQTHLSLCLSPMW